MYIFSLMDYFKGKFKSRLGTSKKVLPLMRWTILASFIFGKHYSTMCSGLSYLKSKTSSFGYVLKVLV